jgi:hypothetical protein
MNNKKKYNPEEKKIDLPYDPAISLFLGIYPKECD